jgi:hypothetical protein
LILDRLACNVSRCRYLCLSPKTISKHFCTSYANKSISLCTSKVAMQRLFKRVTTSKYFVVTPPVTATLVAAGATLDTNDIFADLTALIY